MRSKSGRGTVSNVLAVGTATVGHQDDLETVTQAAVGRRAERGFEGKYFVVGKGDMDQGRLLPCEGRIGPYPIKATPSAAS